jgi:isoquinoline 1-oxidoreductase
MNEQWQIEPERYEFFEDPAFALELDRREFFRVAGAGLLVALVLRGVPALAQRGGFGGSGPDEISAWLHVGADGVVTAYTGKVEVGQNSRTSLTQTVAEELRLPVGRIKLVMGDTQLCPFDGGTFGSGTTPRMVPQIRRAAAAAREVLLDMAAAEGKVDRAGLVVQDGKVVEKASGKTFAFGDLTKGKKIVKTIGRDVKTTAAADWKVVGTSVPKMDGRAIVTGTHQYSPDVKRPGMLFGKVLRPPTLKSTLASVETREAEAMPGVKVVHDGEFVAVAAPTEQAAEQAIAAIRAEWKTPEQPSGDKLFAYIKEHTGGGGGRGGGFGGRGGGGSRGSVADGLKDADQKADATYTIAYIAHVPLEPRAAVAEWADDKLTVWCGTQGPFRVKSDVARQLKVDEGRVRVIVPDTGSGYGGKHTNEAAVEAARLSRASGKPVKVVWTREEEFTWAYFRPAGVIEVKGGAKKDGTLTAWEFHNYLSGGSALATPYSVPNVRQEFHGADSPLRSGSYRALAATANHFARESVMDELASALKLDPLEFRLKNLKDERLRAVLQAAAKHFGWGKEKAAEGRGFGIAGGTEKGSYVATCAEVAADKKTGKVQVVRLVSAFECGAVVNPDQLKNQLEGAAVMGLGGALFEVIRFDKGKILNAHLADYRVPRFADAPAIEAVLLDRKDLASAGAGETPIVTVAPAVGNAIFAASGVRLRSMPMVPNGLKV